MRSPPTVEANDLQAVRDWLLTANKVELATQGPDIIAKLIEALTRAVEEYEDYRFGPGRPPDALKREFAVRALRHVVSQNILDVAAFANEVESGAWPRNDGAWA